MRFSRLSLERYGRFENGELDFPPGEPDLHIIYGANEAGKSTSLDAVSDLLFGFARRSPYSFLFDTSLLRVGAVLEDGGRTFTCRRKTGTRATLVDARDKAIGDAPLLAMLKGQTRETFRLSFSLGQNGLRAGGRAMLEASSDLGRTLFAAGSGLAGIADELTRLEGEADAIWGPQAAARRSFTQAERELAASTKAIRETELRPRTWSDAKTALDRAADALNRVEEERDSVRAELSAAERIRRLAPHVQLRDQQLEELHSYDGVTDIGKAREDSAESIIRDADTAQRAGTVADRLLCEARERKAKIAVDPAVLAEADAIDGLVSIAGAVEKAAHDVIQLEADFEAADRTIRDLRAEAGPNADATPTRAIATRLRDLAVIHARTIAAKAQIEEVRARLEQRRREAKATLEAIGADQVAEALIDAVDAARALGADADARCDEARRKADTARKAIESALDRLTPWTGTMESLRRLPKVAAAEIEQVRDELRKLEEEIRAEKDEATRQRDAATAASLDIQRVDTGSAVSPEEIATAQQVRAEHWMPIREHVLHGVPLAAPGDAVTAFEESIDAVDEKMERRFALADASSRLSLLEKDKATHELRSGQAGARAADAVCRRDELLGRWTGRLTAAGLPTLEPTRFQAWQADREATEAAQVDCDRLAGDADAMAARRHAVRAALSAALGKPDSPENPALAPVLAEAERQRRAGEQLAQKRQLAQAALDQIGHDEEALEQRLQQIDRTAADNDTAWTATMAQAGLELDVSTCGAALDVIEQLRTATASQAQLGRRIDGIRRDALDHASRVNALADKLALPPCDPVERLRVLRDRLAGARAAAKVLETVEDDERKRSGEADEADARLHAADAALAPLMAETGSPDRATLADAIERSRKRRSLAEALAKTEQLIIAGGDGLGLAELVAAARGTDPDELAGRVSRLDAKLTELNSEVAKAATAHGDAMRTFSNLQGNTASAADAAAGAEQARSELEVLAEHYILKRAQALTLKWTIEQYRERHQDPLLLRASELFSILTLGRFAALRVDNDGTTPRLLGMRDDRRTMVAVQHMSEGTTDQLFLALRLAALEQSVKSGVNLPFLADDLFVNFDDERAEAGFKVLVEVAHSTQVLFFTHHPHLVAIARAVVGADRHSVCTLV